MSRALLHALNWPLPVLLLALFALGLLGLDFLRRGLLCNYLLCGLLGHDLFLGSLLRRGLLCDYLLGSLFGHDLLLCGLLRRSFLGGLLGRRLLGHGLLWRGLAGSLFRRSLLLGGLLYRRLWCGYCRNHDHFAGYLIVIRGGKYAGGLDFFLFFVRKVFDVIGVQLFRLPSGLPSLIAYILNTSSIPLPPAARRCHQFRLSLRASREFCSACGNHCSNSLHVNTSKTQVRNAVSAMDFLLLSGRFSLYGGLSRRTCAPVLPVCAADALRRGG